jgi:hypothetical protein
MEREVMEAKQLRLARVLRLASLGQILASWREKS